MKNIFLLVLFTFFLISCNTKTITPDSNVAIPKSANILAEDNQQCLETVFIFIARKGDLNAQYKLIFQKYPDVQAIFADEQGTWGIIQPIPIGKIGVKKGNCITTTIKVVQITKNGQVRSSNTHATSSIIAKILDWF